MVRAFFVYIFFLSAACGTFGTNKIYGGTNTDISEAPFLVQIENTITEHQFCTGTILNRFYVLTAARCTIASFPIDLRVRSGTSALNSGGVITYVKQIFQNPSYQPEFSYDFDLTVLLLFSPIEMNEITQPIALSLNEPMPGAIGIVYGWGTVNDNDVQLVQLQSITIPVVSKDDCNELYDNLITQRMFCAGEQRKTFCSKDYGSPLIINGTQFGIASWRHGCSTNDPGVYSSVSYFIDFINESTNGTAIWE